jgi:threonine/homoserine/homoserine lactone efflux protein
MSVPEALLQFAVVAALLTVIPGLDTVLVLQGD